MFSLYVAGSSIIAFANTNANSTLNVTSKHIMYLVKTNIFYPSKQDNY
ncbi:hypothetical protein KTC98_23540 (plasmid) [Clostridium estertheticum]|nr:hypothetical protein KTC98_23540 [Clostridium estertheticum]